MRCRRGDRRRWCGDEFWSKTHLASARDPVSESPPCAGGAVVRPDDGAVDHLDSLTDALDVVQHLEQQIPEPGERPPTKLPIDRRPFSEELGQIAPLGTDARDPEDAVEHKTMILRPPAAVRASPRHEWLEERPLLVAHQVSNQRRRPPKATLNHSLARSEILFVNRT